MLEGTQKEYHKNGQLAYIVTIKIITKVESLTMSNHRIHNDGTLWIRVGLNAKYYDNGQVNWKLEFNDVGSLIKEKRIQYYKDGTVLSVSIPSIYDN